MYDNLMALYFLMNFGIWLILSTMFRTTKNDSSKERDQLQNYLIRRVDKKIQRVGVDNC